MIRELLNDILTGDCIIKERFNIYCPGCGGTRALKALFRLQLLESLKYNPFVIGLAIDIILTVVLTAIELKTGSKGQFTKLKMKYNAAMLIICLGYAVIRDIILALFGVDWLGDII